MKRHREGAGTDCGGERARWVREYRASGKGLKRFADEHGLSAGQLHYWVYGGCVAKVTRSVAPVFQEVVLPAAMSAKQADWEAEIALTDGTRIRLSRGVDVAWAANLVKSLRPPCSL